MRGERRMFRFLIEEIFGIIMFLKRKNGRKRHAKPDNKYHTLCRLAVWRDFSIPEFYFRKLTLPKNFILEKEIGARNLVSHMGGGPGGSRGPPRFNKISLPSGAGPRRR